MLPHNRPPGSRSAIRRPGSTRLTCCGSTARVIGRAQEALQGTGGSGSDELEIRELSRIQGERRNAGKLAPQLGSFPFAYDPIDKFAPVRNQPIESHWHLFSGSGRSDAKGLFSA